MSESNEKWIIRRNQLKFADKALYRDAATYFVQRWIFNTYSYSRNAKSQITPFVKTGTRTCE